MHHLPRVVISTGLLFLSTTFNPSHSEGLDLQLLSSRLENALNSRNSSRLEKVIVDKNLEDFKSNYQRFLNNYQNTKWIVNPSVPLRDKKKSLEVMITGERQIGDHVYSLDVKQKIAITIQNKKISSQEILNEYSILQTNKKNIPITLGIPDTVLTGSKYHIDLVLEKPLGGTILAGGLISTNREEINQGRVPKIELTPMTAGGLFKTVQAPIQPGTQTWVLVLAHPEGIISVTKLVRIVSDKSDIYL